MARTSTIKREIGNLKRLRNQVPNQAYKIIQQHQDEILDYIREKQLFEKGIDGKGNRLKPYTSFTIAMKKMKGEVYNRTTLLDEGDFYEGFKMISRDYEMRIWSRDIKTAEIVEKYGPDIFTFTIENNRIINENIIKPKLIEWLISNIQF